MIDKKALLLRIIMLALILTVLGNTFTAAFAESGYSTSSEHVIVCPRDPASGQIVVCPPQGNGVKSPRDASSGGH